MRNLNLVREKENTNMKTVTEVAEKEPKRVTKSLQQLQTNYEEHELALWGEIKQIAESRLNFGVDDGQSTTDTQTLLSRVFQMQANRLLLECANTEGEHLVVQSEHGNIV